MNSKSNRLISVALAFAFAIFPACSSEEQSNCDCKADEDCEPGFLCDTELCECYRYYECTIDEDCSWGSCLECSDHKCISRECFSQADCDPIGYCCVWDDDQQCNLCMHLYCGAGSCDIECEEDERGVAVPPCCECECRQHCGGTCPDGTYCCRLTQTCDPPPLPCPFDVDCPAGMQLNPNPGGTLNEETCEIEGADCRCVMVCTDDSDCPADQCCLNEICEEMDCTDLDCGPDLVCGMQCGSCPAGESCIEGVCQ